MIPGMNLLQTAMQVITPTSGVAVKAYLGEGENDFGSTVVQYADAVPLFNCSVQPVKKEQIQVLGLAVNKNYIGVWTTTNSEGAYRGRQNDIILWNGKSWEVMPEEDWMVQDGWTHILAVQL